MLFYRYLIPPASELTMNGYVSWLPSEITNDNTTTWWWKSMSCAMYSQGGPATDCGTKAIQRSGVVSCLCVANGVLQYRSRGEYRQVCKCRMKDNFHCMATASWACIRILCGFWQRWSRCMLSWLLPYAASPNTGSLVLQVYEAQKVKLTSCCNDQKYTSTCGWFLG